MLPDEAIESKKKIRFTYLGYDLNKRLRCDIIKSIKSNRYFESGEKLQ